jgi:WD40 repeat protein
LKTLSSANKNSITRLLTVANEPNIAFCAHRDGDVVVWDLRAEVPLHSLTASLNVDGVQHIDVSNDLLAVSNSTPDGAISLWNWRTGILAWRQIPAPNMPELDGGKNYIGAQLILEGRVYVGTREGYIFVYDVGSGDEMVKLHHGGHVDGLCRHEGSLISLGNGTIKVWDVASQSIVRERKITDHGFSSFCVMDGFIVVLGANGAASSAGRQSVIDAWSLQDPAVVKRVNTTEDWIRSMVCLEDELVLLVKRYEGWRIEKVPFS